ncbi:putative attachment glycoprotein [Roseibium sp. TrichSKD4]|nr:putative attachment glycoprotein [Roseibium sp. TrichSKD4]
MPSRDFQAKSNYDNKKEGRNATLFHETDVTRHPDQIPANLTTKESAPSPSEFAQTPRSPSEAH